MTVETRPRTERVHRRPYPNHARISFRSARAAAMCLAGLIGFPFWYGLLVYALPAPASRLLAQFLPGDLLAHSWLQIGIVGGAAWGWRLARILDYPHPWRLVVACTVGVGIGQVLATGPIQRFIIDPLLAIWGGAPFHVRFALQFALGIGAVVVMTGVALGIALQSWRVAASLALVGSFAAAAPASGVLVIMDLLGIRVGAGHANMAKVMVLGFLVATVAGGALFGWVLARHVAPIPPDTREPLRSPNS